MHVVSRKKTEGGGGGEEQYCFAKATVEPGHRFYQALHGHQAVTSMAKPST